MYRGYIRRLDNRFGGVYAVMRGDKTLFVGNWRACYLFAEGYGADQAAELRYIMAMRKK